MKLPVEELFDAMAVMFNALRRHGLTPDEIVTYYPVADPHGDPAFGFVVEVNGRRWAGAVADCTDPDGFMAEWKRFAVDSTRLSDARFHAAWERWMSADNFATLGVSLASAGIPLRAVAKRFDELFGPRSAQ